MAACLAVASGCGDDDDGAGSGLPVDESTPFTADDSGVWVVRSGKFVRVDNELEVVGPVESADYPQAAAAGAGALWIANDDTLYRIDPKTRRPSGPPVDLGAGDDDPFASDIAVGGGTVWVVVDDGLYRVDAASGRVLGRTKLDVFVHDLIADDGAAYIAVGPSPADGSDTAIMRVDAATGDVRSVQPEPERGIFFAQLAVGAGQVWVTQSRTAAERGKTYTQDTGTVTRYDAKSLEQRGRPTPVSPDPEDILVTPDTAWITDRSGDIAVVDARTGARRPSPAPLAGPAVVAGDARTVYLWERGGKLHAFDQKSAEPVGEARDVNDVPGEIVLTAGSIWLLDEPTQDLESDDEPPWSVMRLDR